jgi:hypothetical protein
MNGLYPQKNELQQELFSEEEHGYKKKVLSVRQLITKLTKKNIETKDWDYFVKLVRQGTFVTDCLKILKGTNDFRIEHCSNAQLLTIFDLAPFQKVWNRHAEIRHLVLKCIQKRIFKPEASMIRQVDQAKKRKFLRNQRVQRITIGKKTKLKK